MSEPYWSALAGGFVDYIGPWAAGTTYAPGAVVSYNGVNYLAVNPSTGVVPAGGIASDIGTTLPASPFDGQEFTLVDSLTAPTYAWKFRYVAAAASNKWMFVGGSPLSARVAASDAITSTTFAVPPTNAGPAITLPVAGIYMVTVGANLSPGSGTDTALGMSFDIGATAAAEANSFYGMSAASGVAVQVAAERTTRVTVAAVTILTCKYRVITAGNNITVLNREIRAVPIAVGG